MDLNAIIITEMKEIHTTTYERPVRLQMKNRASFGLSFAISGKIVYHHNGKEYVLDRDHALFYPMNATYELECQIPGCFTLVNFQCLDGTGYNEFASMKISDVDYFLKNHVFLEKLDLINKQYHQPQCLSILYDTIAHLQECRQERSTVPLLRSAISYMNEHLTDPAISNHDIATYLKISEVYFRKLFKASYDMSPGQYIQYQRLEKAKNLLVTSRLSITNIASACGYTSIYHFCRIFKKQTGYTPSAFRNSFKNSCL